MNHCPVTADLDRYLAEQDRNDSRGEFIDTKLDELMESSAEVGSALDILMGDSDVGSDGNTLFAADMAAVLLASDAAFGYEAVQFFHKLRDRVRDQLRADAETLVDADLAASEESAAEARYEAQQADREAGMY
ncbi:hypothetical protein [Xanthomonas phage MET23-P3]|nr:hypothetical protein [Xanthomonas phage MET23-P3]